VVAACILCDVATRTEQLEIYTKFAKQRATWKAANDPESLVLQV
jgi:hypothetical protein